MATADDECAQFDRQFNAAIDVIIDEMFHVDALDELEGDVINVAGLAQMIDLNDILVDQVGRSVRVNE